MSELIVPKDRNLQRLIQYNGLDKVKIINAKVGAYQFNPALNLKQPKDTPLGVGSLGTPVYTDLTLMGCSYTDNITGETVTLENDRYRSGSPRANIAGNNNGIGSAFYQNLETVLITVSKPKRVITTEIQGRDGTVKEYIGAADAQITINGIITGNNGVYPRDEVNRLVKWLDAPVSKNITAWWLGNLGIDRIVVQGYSIPQVQGGYSYQIFSIDAISDLPVELKITS